MKVTGANLTTRKVLRQFNYGELVTPQHSLDDIRMDFQHSHAYLSSEEGYRARVAVMATDGN